MDVRACQGGRREGRGARAGRQGPLHPGDADLPLSRPLDVGPGQVPHPRGGGAGARGAGPDRAGAPPHARRPDRQRGRTEGHRRRDRARSSRPPPSSPRPTPSPIRPSCGRTCWWGREGARGSHGDTMQERQDPPPTPTSRRCHRISWRRSCSATRHAAASSVARHGGASTLLHHALAGPYQFATRVRPAAWIFVDEPELASRPHVSCRTLGMWQPRAMTGTAEDWPISRSRPSWVLRGIIALPTENYDKERKRASMRNVRRSGLWLLDPRRSDLADLRARCQLWLAATAQLSSRSTRSWPRRFPT